MVRGRYAPRVTRGMSRGMRSRQVALSRMSRSTSAMARRSLAQIRSRAIRNLNVLRRGLAARAVLRRAMRRRYRGNRVRRYSQIATNYNASRKRRRMN